jgi:hypothetical protein
MELSVIWSDLKEVTQRGEDTKKESQALVVEALCAFVS